MKIHKILNEAFSASMPIWLQNYILYNMEFPDKYGNFRPKKEPKTASKDYLGLRGARLKDIGRDKTSTLAINVLVKNLKIDLSRATFHEVTPIPKLNGPMFSDPSKLCISYLKSQYDETVWITGKSSPHERFVLNDGKVITLQSINNKQYQSVCQGFCWLDLNDPNNFAKTVSNQRDFNPESDERNRSEGKRAEMYAKSGIVHEFDKSGYKRVPLVKRYADELAKIKKTKLASQLLEVREKLVTLRDDLKSVFDISLEDSADREIPSVLYNATSNFDDAMKYLYDCIDKVNEISKNNPSGKDLTEAVNDFEASLHDCNTRIKWANRKIKPYIPATIDDSEIQFSDDDWSGF